jgi:hypothetical protein
MLPRVLDEKNMKQQICVVTHVVPISESAVPEKFGKKCLRELWILPTAILQKLQSVFADVCVFDEFLDIAKK